MERSPDIPLDDESLADVRRVLDRHSVCFTLLFGSGTRAPTTEIGDLDFAVEFDDFRPEDDGYSEVYLRLLSDLEETLEADVDVVDVHTMSPQFARVVFDHGILMVGSERRRGELKRDLAGDAPTVGDARERVAAAVDRLREGSSG